MFKQLTYQPTQSQNWLIRIGDGENFALSLQNNI